MIRYVSLVLLAALTVTALQQLLQYNRLRKLYRPDFIRSRFREKMWRLYPLMPKPEDLRYVRTAALLEQAGFCFSVESFYLAKVCLMSAACISLVNIQVTSVNLQCQAVIDDLNYNRTAIEAYRMPESQRTIMEQTLFRSAREAVKSGRPTFENLSSAEGRALYVEYISQMISVSGKDVREDTQEMAERLYEKLVKVSRIETQYHPYVQAFLVSVVMFFLPNMLAAIKIRLIEDKRDWEVLHCINVFSIFGRLPPYSLKAVLSAMLLVSELYSSRLGTLLNGVKSGKAEAVFEQEMQTVENQELYELLALLKLSANTGFQGIADAADEMAEDYQNWMEVKNLKRRKTKQLYAMVPVAAAMLLAAVYFSYSLTILTNPSNFIK